MRDISLHLMDIAQNSVVANATNIEIIFSVCSDILKFIIIDNGKGMSEELVRKVFDPFTTSRTTRRVGLGIPLLVETAEMTGGGVSIDSSVGVGTTLTATYALNHIDRIPLGDIAFTMATLISGNENINFKLTLSNNQTSFSVTTEELKIALGFDVSLNQISIIEWLNEYIDENIKIIFGGILDEIVS